MCQKHIASLIGTYNRSARSHYTKYFGNMIISIHENSTNCINRQYLETKYEYQTTVLQNDGPLVLALMFETIVPTLLMQCMLMSVSVIYSVPGPSLKTLEWSRCYEPPPSLNRVYIIAFMIFCRGSSGFGTGGPHSVWSSYTFGPLSL